MLPDAHESQSHEEVDSPHAAKLSGRETVSAGGMDSSRAPSTFSASDIKPHDTVYLHTLNPSASLRGNRPNETAMSREDQPAAAVRVEQRQVTSRAQTILQSHPISPQLAPLVRTKKPPAAFECDGTTQVEATATVILPQQSTYTSLNSAQNGNLDSTLGVHVEGEIEVKTTATTSRQPNFEHTQDAEALWSSVREHKEMQRFTSPRSPDVDAQNWSIPSETSPPQLSPAGRTCKLDNPSNREEFKPGLEHSAANTELVASVDTSHAQGLSATWGADESRLLWWQRQLQEEVGHSAARALVSRTNPIDTQEDRNVGSQRMSMQPQSDHEHSPFVVSHKWAWNHDECIESGDTRLGPSPHLRHSLASPRTLEPSVGEVEKQNHGNSSQTPNKWMMVSGETSQAAPRSKVTIKFSDLTLMHPPIGTGSNKTVYKATWHKRVVVSALPPLLYPSNT